MNSIVKILAVSMLFAVQSYAVPKAKIIPMMEKKIEAISSMLKDKSKPLMAKRDKIFSIVDDMFDYKLMAKIALAKAYKSGSKEQIALYTKRFEQKLKLSYFNKLRFYDDQVTTVGALTQPKATRIVVPTTLKGKATSLDILYKFYKSKSGDNWRIYDVDIAHVSLMQTYRKQFSQYLKNHTLDELIKTLK